MAEPEDLALKRIPGYELLRPVGRGGAGVAYLARQLSLDRRVVVKFLFRDSDGDPLELAARLRREALFVEQASAARVPTALASSLAARDKP